jgi:acyl carrier protein
MATEYLDRVGYSDYAVGIPDTRGATMTTPDVLEKSWTVNAIEELTLELLANLLRRDVVELSRELRTKAPAMPVDSLDMFDILQEFRDRTGLNLPVRQIRRNTLRSVRAFAEFAIGGVND